MKNLNLESLNLGASNVLSREQLKKIIGGTSCTSPADCAFGEDCVDGECATDLGGFCGTDGTTTGCPRNWTARHCGSYISNGNYEGICEYNNFCYKVGIATCTIP